MITWLASYPRSGNTFFRVLLNSAFGIKTYSIYNDIHDIGADEQTADIVGHELLPEDFDVEQLRNSEKIYYIKTHGRSDIVDGNDKVIYLVRDGRESTLSYMNYLNNYQEKKKTLTDVISGDVPFGGWGDHVADWEGVSEDAKMVLKFEDLIADPESNTKSIGSFLGVDMKGGMPPTFDELQKINPKFFNKGNTESWKSVYSKGQTLYFNLKYYQSLYRNSYDVTDISEAGLVGEKSVSDMLTYFEGRIRHYLKLEDTLVDMDCRYSELLKQFETKSNYLQHKDTLLEEKDGMLSEKYELLLEQYQRADEKNAVIQKRDNKITQKNQSIEALTRRIENMEVRQGQLKLRYEQLEKRAENQSEKLSKLTMLHREINELFSVKLIKNPMRKLKMYRELGQKLDDRNYT